MEKVKVVKPVPGILSVDDILVSPFQGEDFRLEEMNVTELGSNERFVSLDYVTVSENIPEYFEFEFEPDDSEGVVEYEEELLHKCFGCENCTCKDEECDIQDSVRRTNEAIADRYDFFESQFEAAEPGSEAQIVYRNLMWFIEWLQGKTELI
jgi:hypothetical protein